MGEMPVERSPLRGAKCYKRHHGRLDTITLLDSGISGEGCRFTHLVSSAASLLTLCASGFLQRLMTCSRKFLP